MAKTVKVIISVIFDVDKKALPSDRATAEKVVSAVFNHSVEMTIGLGLLDAAWGGGDDDLDEVDNQRFGQHYDIDKACDSAFIESKLLGEA